VDARAVDGRLGSQVLVSEDRDRSTEYLIAADFDNDGLLLLSSVQRVIHSFPRRKHLHWYRSCPSYPIGNARIAAIS